MLMAQGRIWRADLRRGSEALSLTFTRDGLPEDLQELRDLKIEVPLTRWNGVVKHARSNRKLLGGILLDFARDKDHLAAALADDRLYGELQQLVLEATASLIEEERLGLAVPASEES